MLRSETVLDIDYHSSTMDGQPYFTVTTSKGVHHALTVVLAVGAGNDPKIPAELSNHKATEGACHAFHITTFPPPHVQAKIAARIPTNIVVIDGGLTSAQLADLAIKHGVVESMASTAWSSKRSVDKHNSQSRLHNTKISM